MDINENKLLEKIKTAKGKRYLSNCYSLNGLKNLSRFWEVGDSFLYTYNDHGIVRGEFFVESYDILDKLIMSIDQRKYYLEFMTKNPEEYKPKETNLVARMIRIANLDCSGILKENALILKYKDSVDVSNASEQEAEEINRILWNTFHTEISHLLYDEEIRAKIREGKITIHRNVEGCIDALLQADVMPKKFYINQIVNKAEKNVIHAILINRLQKYIEAGGRYIYAWVDDTNIASVKFHEKYGMKHDGMWNMVYCVEK